jgi:hypothetical protein
MRKSRWLILSIVVLVIGFILYNTYSNQITSITIYKHGNKGLERIVEIPRDDTRDALFDSLENSFRHQKDADPKSDGLIEAPYFKFEVKKRFGSDTMELWVTKEKVGIQKGDRYKIIEGEYTDAINIFLNGLL